MTSLRPPELQNEGLSKKIKDKILRLEILKKKKNPFDLTPIFSKLSFLLDKENKLFVQLVGNNYGSPKVYTFPDSMKPLRRNHKNTLPFGSLESYHYHF